MEKAFALGTQVDPWLSLEVNLMILLLSLGFQALRMGIVANLVRMSLPGFKLDWAGSRIKWRG